MKTITFDGDTQEEAEAKKDRWLSENKGVTVRQTRVHPLFTTPDPRAKLQTATSIELDFDESN